MRNRLSLLVSFLALLICFLSTSLAAEPEEVWRNLSKSSGQERQKLLLSKARAEGEILWYTTLSADLLEPLREDFERRYPGAQARFWRGRGETVANRVLTEARAGTFNVDVVSGSNENVTVLKKADLVGRYGSPERRFYSNAHKDREEYWTSLINLLAIMAYNTRLVPKAEAVIKVAEKRSKEDWL